MTKSVPRVVTKIVTKRVTKIVTKRVTKTVTKKEDINSNYDNLNTLLFLILGL